MVWCGLSVGYFLHLLEDSFSVAGIRWFNPFTPYDEWAYEHYHTLMRPVNYYDKIDNGKKVPVRHWWGRGYETGSDDELVIVGFSFFLALVALIRAMFF